MFLADYPIDKKENDKLGRFPLALKVAEMISKFKGNESFVIGIEGPWGSGKTSFVNMVLSELNSTEIVTISFNPWNFSGQNELISDFFASIASAVKEFQEPENIKKLKSIASKLTKKSEASFSPEISVWGIKIKASDLFKWGVGEKTLQEERTEMDSLFRSFNKKIVIVIDDIDRLDKYETRLIMKLVKMTGNFPNTVFLLAYDRLHVTRRLQEDGWPGDEFLKKIVQVSFTLPKPDEEEMKQLLFHDLDETIEISYGQFKLEGEAQKRWNKIIYAGFSDFFKTIRDIKRYTSSLRLNWSIVNIADVNMIDFITIEAIRVFFPRFYSIIGANKSFFLASQGVFASTNYHDTTPKRQEQFNELLDEGEIKDSKDRKLIKEICEELFPQLENQNYGSDWEITWRNDQRICADTRFNLYFQLGIPTGSVSEVEVNNIIDLLDNKEKFSEEIIRLSLEKRIRPLLSRIGDRSGSLQIDRLKTLILALWDLEDKVMDVQTAVFDFDDFDSTSFRMSYHAIKTISSREDRKKFIDEMVDKTISIYNPIRIIRTIEEEVEKNPQQGNFLLQQDDLKDSKEILLKRIQKLKDEKKLHKIQHLPFILYTWKKWAGEELVKTYVSELVKIKDNTVFLIEGFVGMTYSSDGNYKDIDKKSLGDLYPIEELEKIVTTITDADLEKMTQNQREAIAVFRNPPKGWH
jgi:predicted KAP-like P-loop ATPase